MSSTFSPGVVSPGVVSPSSPSYLSQSQRTRLIKSTRKLAKILGTTPLLQVTPPSPHHAHPIYHRTRSRAGSRSMHDIGETIATTPVLNLASLDPHHAPSWQRTSDKNDNSDASSIRSTASAPAHTAHREHDAVWNRAHPVFRYKPKNRPDFTVDTAAAQRLSVTSQMSPTASVDTHSRSNSNASMLSTITSSRSRIYSISSIRSSMSLSMDAEKLKAREIRARRKRIAKLARYLGEPVPPALVQPIQDPAAKVWRMRSRISLTDTDDAASSVQAVEDAEHTPPVSLPVADTQVVIVAPTTPDAHEISSLTYRSDPRSPNSVPVRFAVPADVDAVASRAPHLRSRSDALPPRARSLFEPEVFINEDYPRRSESRSELYLSPDDIPARSESRIAMLRAVLGRDRERDEPPVAHRSERRQGWSGEWNAASVQDVISRLRNLK